MASSSISPDSIKMDWEEYQHWMIDAFRYMHQASEIEKLASINVAYDRREEWLKEEAIRTAEREAKLAEKQKIVDARDLF